MSAANTRGAHWHARSKPFREQRLVVGRCLEVPLTPFRSVALKRVSAHLERQGPRVLDSDNLAYAFKAVRDEVAKRLGLPDDSDLRVRWTYSQTKARKYEIVISVEATLV